MKITDITSILEQQSAAAKKTAKSSQNSFENVLNEKINSTDASKSSQTMNSAVSQTPMIHLNAPITASSGITTMGAQMTVDRVDQALDLLEQYQTALADPGTSLKDLASTVQSMEEEADNLSSLLPSMTGDQQGSELIEKVSTLMKVESIKFKRGDYL